MQNGPDDSRPRTPYMDLYYKFVKERERAVEMLAPKSWTELFMLRNRHQLGNNERLPELAYSAYYKQLSSH